MRKWIKKLKSSYKAASHPRLGNRTQDHKADISQNMSVIVVRRKTMGTRLKKRVRRK